MKNWKTTVAGLAGGIGIAIEAIARSSSEPTTLFGGITLGGLGAGLTALAFAWGFVSARDYNVTSEGTKTKSGL